MINVRAVFSTTHYLQAGSWGIFQIPSWLGSVTLKVFVATSHPLGSYEVESNHVYKTKSIIFCALKLLLCSGWLQQLIPSVHWYLQVYCNTSCAGFQSAWCQQVRKQWRMYLLERGVHCCCPLFVIEAQSIHQHQEPADGCSEMKCWDFPGGSFFSMSCGETSSYLFFLTLWFLSFYYNRALTLLNIWLMKIGLLHGCIVQYFIFGIRRCREPSNSAEIEIMQHNTKVWKVMWSLQGRKEE